MRSARERQCFRWLFADFSMTCTFRLGHCPNQRAQTSWKSPCSSRFLPPLSRPARRLKPQAASPFRRPATALPATTRRRRRSPRRSRKPRQASPGRANPSRNLRPTRPRSSTCSQSKTRNWTPNSRPSAAVASATPAGRFPRNDIPESTKRAWNNPALTLTPTKRWRHGYRCRVSRTGQHWRICGPYSGRAPRQLADPQILSRRLSAVFLLLVAHLGAFVERRKAGLLDGRNVHEYVLAATIRLNEPISLCWVEPLHSSCRHVSSPVLPHDFRSVMPGTASP